MPALELHWTRPHNSVENAAIINYQVEGADRIAVDRFLLKIGMGDSDQS
jgi:hypothetical protein